MFWREFFPNIYVYGCETSSSSSSLPRIKISLYSQSSVSRSLPEMISLFIRNQSSEIKLPQLVYFLNTITDKLYIIYFAFFV